MISISPGSWDDEKQLNSTTKDNTPGNYWEVFIGENISEENIMVISFFEKYNYNV